VLTDALSAVSCCVVLAGCWVVQRGAASGADYAQGTIIEIEESLPGEDHDPWQSITVLWDDDWSHLNLRSKVGQGRVGWAAKQSLQACWGWAGRAGQQAGRDVATKQLVAGQGIRAAARMHLQAMYTSHAYLPAERC